MLEDTRFTDTSWLLLVWVFAMLVLVAMKPYLLFLVAGVNLLLYVLSKAWGYANEW